MADEDDDEVEEEAEEPDDAGDGDDEEGDGDGAGPKKGGKAKLFIIIGGVLVFLIAAGAGVYFSGILDEFLGLETEVKEDAGPKMGNVFFPLKEITLNLNAEGKKSRFLKVGLTVVLAHSGDVARVEALAPRITDYVATYLRELRPEELSGSANFYRIRERLLYRVRLAVSPIEVTNVLFNSVLVQ
ncbi:MAG: flagellar basal body-associated FliL family protein [Rhodospirillales bacterium]|nr:flagellar basal body-associated FliL family protein [Rhodospirillales bacterium]